MTPFVASVNEGGSFGLALDVEGSFNVRDLGGYPTPDGKLTKTGRFIRAGSLHTLTPNGRRVLLDLGVRCVIDLRSRHEVETKPDAICDDPDFAWRHVPMLDYINSNMAGEINFPNSLEDMYLGLVENSGHSFARLFEIFADPGYNGYLFHCTAGKDRTGVSAMLLLALAGVDEKNIVEDYNRSEGQLPPLPATGAPAFLSEAPHGTMWAVLNYIRQRWGSVRGYLAEMGVSPNAMDAVTSKLLD